jgi:hypothetical protein
VTEFLRGFKWMEPAVDLGRLGLFALFVALGLMAARRRREPGASRRAADRLIVYVLGVSCLVGVTQVESWPFTNWALVNHGSPRRIVSLELEGLDATGHGWVVDLRVLQPLSPEEFATWLKANLAALTPDDRGRLGRFLLDRAEHGRRRLRAGRSPAPNQTLLGPLDAPYHFHDAKTWTSAAQVPATPFVALRAWFWDWDVEERFADPTRVERRLLFEVR